MEKVAICIDASGSCNLSHVRNIFLDITKILVNMMCDKEITLIQFNDGIKTKNVINSEKDIDNIKDIEDLGTDFIKLFSELEDVYSEVIVLTDGYSVFPTNVTTPTTWFINTDVISPFGKTINIKNIQYNKF